MPRSPFGPSRILVVLAATGLPAAAGADPAALLSSLTVHVQSQGAPVPARVQVIDALGHSLPSGPDSVLLSHSALDGYFYTSGSFTLDVPRGLTTITVGRGFEWRPVGLQLMVRRDTTIVVAMEKPYDMRSRHWYAGDVHAHTQHPPTDYVITPADAHLVARAEDLALMWCLDQEYEFSGGPHAVSDGESIIYYSTEYRNQAMGHVSLLGLKRLQGFGCCLPPDPVLPSLTDLYLGWKPKPDEAMVLCHAHTTDDFWMDAGWPGFGLGRELPVQAALGTIDALDLAAYSNEPDIFLTDWYALLNAGRRVVPSAGTDALLGAYDNLPPGGYRVYVKETGSGPHDPDAWVRALRAGRSFVTNYPLIPHFSVNGVEAGDTLSLPGAGAVVTIAFRVECAEPLTAAIIHCNGASPLYVPLYGQHVVDIERTLVLTESSWVALRVYGQRTLVHAVEPLLFAHTAPVFVLLDGQPIESTLDSARMLHWIDDLEEFANQRDGAVGPGDWSRFTQQLDDARSVYLQSFRQPPGEFALLSPGIGDTILPTSDLVLEWEVAVDPEPGDEVTYYVRFSTDSTLTGLDEPGVQTPWLVIPIGQFLAGETYWWRVRAVDFAGNETVCTPPVSWLYVDPNVVPVGEPPAAISARASVWPNPAWGSRAVRIGAGSDWDRIRILDVAGRIVARGSLEDGFPACFRREDTRHLLWDGRDERGRLLPAGRYWVELMPRPDAPGQLALSRRREIVPLTLVR